MRHPLGTGIPGPQNWSGTDEDTIRTSPLGSIPEIVQWSASIVRTPRGWVGRIDNHIKKTTVHVPVEGQAAEWIFEIKAPSVYDVFADLYDEFDDELEADEELLEEIEW